MKKRIKKSYICKQVKDYTLSEPGYHTRPQAGDVALFEVLTIGKHSSIQGEEKRNITLYPGDVIMAAFGTRYATEQFEGYLPKEPLQEYHILGAGGTVGVVASMHSKFTVVGPTCLRLVGFAVDETGAVINTRRLQAHLLKPFKGVMPALTRVVLSIGSSMDSGKTTTAAHLVRGLKNAGMRTGFIKLTGTVYTKDCDLAYDNGADAVADFGDMGFPSTYLCSEAELLGLYETLLTRIGAQDLDYVVVEIADGIYQRETEMLLRNGHFLAGIDGVVFSAGDSLAAVQGTKALQELHIIPLGLCGVFTASPLLVQEVQARVQLPIFTLADLANGACVALLEEPLSAYA